MKEKTSRAVGVCQRLSKPSSEHKKILSQLYPSCSSNSTSSSSPSASFNPMKASVSEMNQLKKKAAIPGKGVKPKSITAVFLESKLPKVPRGRSRKKLEIDGRIKKLFLRRSMSSVEVKQAIFNCFSLAKDKEIVFLKSNSDNSLEVNSNQLLTGNEAINVAGCGSLYLVEEVRL